MKRAKMWPTRVEFEDLPHHLQIHRLENSIERLKKRMAIAVEALEAFVRIEDEHGLEPYHVLVGFCRAQIMETRQVLAKMRVT